MLLELGLDGATQGFEPVWQTCPTNVLPLGTPFTNQVTAKSEVFVTPAAKVIRWLTGNVAEGGETVTVMLLASVTDDVAVLAPLVA